jgi:23S rRNA G2069 N7-methylase RlmK/C1962 C5-methylase RlmI
VSRRDYPRLLALALPRLAPQGLLLVCCNTLGAKPADPEQVLSAAEASVGIRLRRLPNPDLDPDLPQLSGFPEGRPFRLVLAQRAQP